MTLDKENIATAKEMSRVLRLSGKEELAVVGMLLDALLKEREAAQLKAEQEPKRELVGLTEEDFVCVHQLCKTPIEAAEYTEHLLKEKNT